MNVRIAYGKEGLAVELPDDVDIVEPFYESGADDQVAVIRAALRDPIGTPPLGSLVKPADRIGIVFSDITRATPYDVIMPAIFGELGNPPDENITLYNATGTHRENTPDELERILGPGVAERYRIVQNRCDEIGAHRHVGKTAGGNDIELLSDFLDCDVKILTGFIEPHFFAGFSGGGKAVMPGLASLSTIMNNHGVAHLDHPQARWGVTKGNPLWEDVTEAAGFARPTFLINVALNRDKRVTAAFAGHYIEAHSVGCEYVRTRAMIRVDSPYDIVVSSNSGYPLDLNMYQAVKGMSAAAQITRPGGHIIMAAECWDGIPAHGQYGRLLAEASSPAEILARIRRPGFRMHDQWQAQIHAKLCEAFNIHFYSDHLTGRQIEDAFMIPCDDIGGRVRELASGIERARICVLPEGPQTIPYIT